MNGPIHINNDRLYTRKEVEEAVAGVTRTFLDFHDRKTAELLAEVEEAREEMKGMAADIADLILELKETNKELEARK